CAVGDGESVDPWQSAVWGTTRVAASELPALAPGLIDLDPAGRTAAATEAVTEEVTAEITAEITELVAELVASDGENEVALRGHRRHVARLSAAGPAPAASRLRDDATYLVTGELPGPALHVARWLVERGARQLVVVRAPGEQRAGVDEAIAALEAQGARIQRADVDLGREAELAALIGALRDAESPLRGVVHAAGVGPVCSLLQTDAAVVDAALRPKVAAAWALHRALGAHALDFFVVFSSGTGVWGSAGHGAGAAADGFLDGLAHLRRARGLPALSVDWGMWDEGAAADPDAAARLAAAGLGAMSTGEALDAMGGLLASHDAQRVVARLDEARFSAVYAARTGRKLFAGLARDAAPASASAVASGSGSGSASASATPRRWNGQSADELRPSLARLVRDTAASVLGFSDPGALDPQLGFAEQGLDSLMAVQIRKRLEAELGVKLSATVAFDHPSVERLVAHLLTDVLALEQAAGAMATRAVVLDEPIAIIGASCRLPGGAVDLEAYWALLSDRRVAATEVSPTRWDPAVWYDANPDAPNRTYVTKAGFLDEVETFDPSVFRISPREAVSLEPQQRLLLEVSWEALERSGRPVASLRDSATGVFVGVGMNEYLDRIRESGELDTYVSTGNSLSVTAGRLSFVLGLHGPSVAIDTACSSSLVAVHLAAQSLRAGECEMALAGGVNVLVSPASFVAMSRIRALSADGRCKTFSADADGYGRGEGCVVVVLKRLSDAQRDGDQVLAVIRGTAVNHDGPSSGLTVPSGPAQQAVIRQALAQAQVAPGAVDFVECHGTGTPLGDPIEVQALSAVYGADRPDDRRLVLGAAKANIGHLEPASGIAGLLKVVLALQHGQIPAQPPISELNANIPWDSSPVEVAREPVAWPRGERPRYAGVSSFGISGTNAHVVLEEAPMWEEPERAATRSAELLVVSAKSAEAVAAQAERLARQLEAAGGAALGDVARSRATTLSAMEERVAVVAETREEATAALAAVARGELPGGVVRGRATGGGSGKIVFVFPGQGSQWLGMGRRLLEEEPAFAEAVAACDRAIQAEAGFSV
ncbi:MAG TPA: beta-ketoacyl synthase N-terminal-like domain-containing protein, partial [Kofleriaceae bacterium]|nr:beta-ketoacyl synthase N-terminal-like domain-containing protein [Kofleriaceae bacterium]